MTEKKKPTRRRIQVGGQEVDPNAEKAPQDRPITDVFKLDQPLADDAGAPSPRTYHEDHLQKFLMGGMTLGELEGITKKQQYEIAQIGFAYLGSGKLDQAKTIFEGLIALDPFDAYFHTALGSIAQQREDFEEAEKRYTRALEINPFSPTAYANRGEIRVMTGKLAEGALDLVKAIQLDPDGKEPASIRAKATVRVIKEQLGALDLDQLEKKAREATGSKVKAVKEATAPRRAPRAQPRSKPRK